MDCETFIDIFVLFCVIAALACYLFTKKSNFQTTYQESTLAVQPDQHNIFPEELFL